MTDYTDPHDGYKALLCSECIKRREKPYTEICPKCKRVAYDHGGIRYYDDSDADDPDDEISYDSDNFDNFDHDEEPPSFELMCKECYDKKIAKVRKIRKFKLILINFVKDHYWKIIALVVAILGLIGFDNIFNPK